MHHKMKTARYTVRHSLNRLAHAFVRTFVPTALLVVVAACKSNSPVSMPATDGWRHLSFEQRHAQMTFGAHPTMAEHYQEFYGTEAPELTCRSCHGKDAERVRYQIAYTPIDDLKPSQVRQLYLPGAELSDEQRFKRDVITPLMAQLLDVPAYDAATGSGFSCFGCHPREEE